jgi:hypothetical protein
LLREIGVMGSNPIPSAMSNIQPRAVVFRFRITLHIVDSRTIACAIYTLTSELTQFLALS